MWGQPQTELTIRDPAKNGGISCVRVWLQDLATDLGWRDPANALLRDRTMACVWSDPAQAAASLEASLAQRTGQAPDERVTLLDHLVLAQSALGTLGTEGHYSSPATERATSAGNSAAWTDEPFDTMPSCAVPQSSRNTIALRL